LAGPKKHHETNSQRKKKKKKKKKCRFSKGRNNSKPRSKPPITRKRESERDGRREKDKQKERENHITKSQGPLSLLDTTKLKTKEQKKLTQEENRSREKLQKEGCFELKERNINLTPQKNSGQSEKTIIKKREGKGKEKNGGSCIFCVWESFGRVT